MNQTELKQALANLHEELTKTAQFDEGTRQALMVLLADIQRVVADPAHAQAADRQDESLTLKLQTAAQDLEIKHPRLTGMLQQIVDRLADLGI